MIQIGGFVHKLYVSKTQEEGIASLYLNLAQQIMQQQLIKSK
jgi:hypothetical protein